MEIQNYRNCENLNVEMSGYLFLSNSPWFVSRMMHSNTNFITFRDVDKRQILRGNISTQHGRTGYCEHIDYSKNKVTITCGLYKDDILVEKLEEYEQSEKPIIVGDYLFINSKKEEIYLDTKFHHGKINIVTPESIPYWKDHPENIRRRDILRSQKERWLHY